MSLGGGGVGRKCNKKKSKPNADWPVRQNHIEFNLKFGTLAIFLVSLQIPSQNTWLWVALLKKQVEAALYWQANIIYT